MRLRAAQPAAPPRAPASASDANDVPHALSTVVRGALAAAVVCFAFFLFLWSKGPETTAEPSKVSASERAMELIRAEQARELAWIEQGKEAVREKLRDPESAQFKSAVFHRGADGAPMSCGLVNSKNGFGGYVGWTRYMSGASSKLTFIESEVEGGFEDTWARFCGGAPRAGERSPP